MDESTLPGITHDAYFRLAELSSAFGDVLRDFVLESARRTGDERPISAALVEQAAIDACDKFKEQLLTLTKKNNQNFGRPAA